MQRKLVLIPPSRALYDGALPIGAGYPKPYAPQQMRAWGGSLGQLYRIVESDSGLPRDQRRLEAWLATPREQLPAEARGVVDAYRNLLSEPDRGIKGELRADGRVELTGGRHRAHYLIERGTDPLPVWVSSADDARLDRFESDCRTAVARSRPEPRRRDEPRQRDREPARPDPSRSR